MKFGVINADASEAEHDYYQKTSTRKRIPPPGAVLKGP